MIPIEYHIDTSSFLNIIDNNKIIDFFFICSSMFQIKEEFLFNPKKYLDIYPQEQYDYLQKAIFDIAKHNINELWNENIDINKHFITFWFKNISDCCSDLHFDTSENDKDTITSILYLHDNYVSPTFLMLMQNGDDKYKLNDFFLSFPKKGRIITFNNKTLHGKFDMFCINQENFSIDNCKNNDRSLLVIKITKEKPKLIPVFDLNLLLYRLNSKQIDFNILLSDPDLYSYNVFNLNKLSNCKDIECPAKLFNSEIIYDAYINKPSFQLNIFKDYIIKNIDSHNFFHIIPSFDNDSNIVENTQSPDDDLLKQKKFNQRLIKSNFFNDIICDWIIFETEKYAQAEGWSTERHEFYPTTDIEIEKINSVFSFCTSVVISEIKSVIENSYKVTLEKINILDLFIVKYDETNQKSLDKHNDISTFTASILLNDNFNGCDVIYDDGFTVLQEKGQLIIHNKNHYHEVSPIINGIRYVLIFFIEII